MFPEIFTKLYGTTTDFFAGRLKTETPVVTKDATNKGYVDAADNAITSIISASATANTIALRDANGQLAVATPTLNGSAATKAYVDAITNLLSVSATANTIMKRDANGRAQIATPSAAADIANKEYVDDLAGLSWRKSWIGVPRWWRSTTLPDDCCWANGDLISLADWPELAEIYEDGGFAGMLLPYDADTATIAANLGKWRPNAANPTGLYTPNLGDQFFRGWVEGLTAGAGTWHRDEIRNIVGNYQAAGYGNYETGPFRYGSATGIGMVRLDSNNDKPINTFDASRVVPTGPQNVPQHVMAPCMIYLGRAA
jgi:hypothetical protein